MVSDATVKLATFSILLNILFPVFAYSFTSLEGSDIEAWDLSISLDDLLNAGIQFDEVTQENITFGGDPITFNNSGDLQRFRWFNKPLVGDILRVTHPSPIEWAWGEITGDYFGLGGSQTPLVIDGEVYIDGQIFNSTLVTKFDTEYNWTRLDLQTQGVVALITPRPEHDFNISEAVYVDGNLTITIGHPRAQDGSFNPGEFVDFYWDMLIGAGDWGLPSVMNWITRILTVITMFSAVLLGRELLNPLS